MDITLREKLPGVSEIRQGCEFFPGLERFSGAIYGHVLRRMLPDMGQQIGQGARAIAVLQAGDELTQFAKIAGAVNGVQPVGCIRKLRYRGGQGVAGAGLGLIESCGVFVKHRCQPAIQNASGVTLRGGRASGQGLDETKADGIEAVCATGAQGVDRHAG